MIDKEPEKLFIITESELNAAVVAMAEDDQDPHALAFLKRIRSRPYSPAPERTKQCKNCRMIGTRACMYHGYPEDTIPPSCGCKLGDVAEEALRCLNGTFIDVWTSEHDAVIRQSVRENHVKDIELIISLCKTLRHHYPNDLSLQMTQEQHERELKKIESLRAGEK